MSLGERLVRRRDSGGQETARAQRVKRAGLGVSTDRVQHYIEVEEPPSEVLGGVVDDLIGAKSLGDCDAVARGGGDDPGTDGASELDGKAAHPARAGVNEDRLTGRKAGNLEECLPRRAGGSGNSGRVLDSRPCRKTSATSLVVTCRFYRNASQLPEASSQS